MTRTTSHDTITTRYEPADDGAATGLAKLHLHAADLDETLVITGTRRNIENLGAAFFASAAIEPWQDTISDVPTAPAGFRVELADFATEESMGGDEHWLLTWTVNGTTIKAWNGDGWDFTSDDNVRFDFDAFTGNDDTAAELTEHLIEMGDWFDAAYAMLIAPAYTAVGRSLSARINAA